MFTESWKFDGEAPTVQDCIKYQQQKTRLLAIADGWSSMLEIVIAQVTPGGMIAISQGCSFMGGGKHWMRPDDLRIIEILPPRDAPASPTVSDLLYGTHQ